MSKRLSEALNRRTVQLCSVKQEKTFKESLTSKELLILYQYLQTEFETMADREKEILAGFLFSCLTGLRYSDICSVEYSNIKRIRNKTLAFPYNEKNRSKKFLCPLNKCSQEEHWE